MNNTASRGYAAVARAPIFFFFTVSARWEYSEPFHTFPFRIEWPAPRLEEHSADGIKNPLSQIQMRCTQLWLVLEKHLSEQRLTEGSLNTRQSQCLTRRRGERCARTAEWKKTPKKTGQRIMMVISSKPKQSHPPDPSFSLSASLSLSPLNRLTPPLSPPLTHTQTHPAPALRISHTTHIDRGPFFFFQCAWATI